MHLTGLLGMPRRIATYPGDGGWDWLNLLSSIGGFLMAMGFALVVVDIIVQVRFGTRVPAQSVGRAHARMGHADAAALLQLRRPCR